MVVQEADVGAVGWRRKGSRTAFSQVGFCLFLPQSVLYPSFTLSM